mgnify:CR=1 FL=1
MEMQGEARIPAPQHVVWEALNDPEALKASIPGCEELTREGADQFVAKVRAKVGPVSARFAGKVTLSEIDPPNSYRIQGEGTGGAAGFAKGGAVVALTADGPDATILKYDVSANVGGKLAQIGARLIDGAARKMADDFFQRFSDVAAKRVDAPPAVAEAPPITPPAAPAFTAAPDPEPAPGEETIERTTTVRRTESSTPNPTPPPAAAAAVEPTHSTVAAQVAEDALAENTRPLPPPPAADRGAPSFMWVAAIGFGVAILLYALF